MIAKNHAGNGILMPALLTRETVMRNILLAVDGSEPSFRAALFLIRFIREHGPADIHVVTVEAKPLCHTGRDAILAHTKMKPVLHALNEEGIAYQSHVKVGKVARTLVSLADELGCDTILMGTRGLGEISGMTLGSVTRKVLHLANQPVLCVK
jgi:nucleotide-binding universal stress UspA family protein